MNHFVRSNCIIFFVALLASCSETLATPIATGTMISSLTPFTPSITPSAIPTTIPSSTIVPTASPEPRISPGCKIVSEDEKFYVLSDREFHDLWSHERIMDQALEANYPEWANYRQIVPWNTEPVKLSEIINSASFDNELNLQINSIVTLVTIGMSLDWELPANSDLFLKSREISLKLNELTFEWDRPGSEQIHLRFPEVSNGATYALYTFYNYDQQKLREWCKTYQRLFEPSP